jgi:hypothetical protein
LAINSWRLAPILALCGLAALSGCGMFGGSKEEAKGPPPATCPTASILKPLSQTAVFSPGAAHQPLGVAFYGVLADVSVKCETVAGGVSAAMDIVVIGERAPAASGGTGLDLQYFVAVTGQDQAILSKQSYRVHVDVAPTARRGGITDHIVQAIPIPAGGPGSVNIVLGFQQTPDVVDFYRHFRGR